MLSSSRSFKVLLGRSLGLCLAGSGGLVLPIFAQELNSAQGLDEIKPTSNRAADLLGQESAVEQPAVTGDPPQPPLKSGEPKLKALPGKRGEPGLKVPLFKGDLGRSLSQAPPATTQPIRITGVKLNPTDAGLEVILETETGTTLKPVTRTEGNALIAEISNATLALNEGPGFTANQPAVGVATVSVTQADAQTVRVSIVGTATVPTASVKFSPSTPTAAKPTTSEEERVEGEEEEIVATGQKEKGYAVPNSNVGTRTDAKLRDVPQSIQVVPKQVIEDQGATDLTDVLRNVPGATASGDPGVFRIRGFNAGGNVFSDGSSALGSSTTTNSGTDFELSNVEQVEVLKGPASVLYGTGQPGGTINLTTEQPLKDPRYEIKATVGNFDFYRGDLDLTGPLNESKSILYRLNIAYQNAGSFVDFINTEQFNIFPVLSFELSKNTKLKLEGGYQTQSGNSEYFGLRSVGTVFPNPLGEVPRSRSLSDPRDNTDFTSIYLGYLLEHNFSKDWSLRNRFRASFSTFDARYTGPGDLEADNRTVPRFAQALKDRSQDYALQTEVLGKVQTGIVRHDLLFGLELKRNIFNRVFRVGDAPPIDLFNPDYGDYPDSDDLELQQDERSINDNIGVYAQNLLSIGKQVKVIIGGRYDWVSQNSKDRLENTETNENATGFAPRAGIVYQPIEPVSLYASWSRSFEPQFGTDREGNPFVPIRGEQFEVGVKTEFLDGRLAATLAAYQVTRQNDFIPDPVDPDNFSIQVGEQRSRGIEFDLTGEPLPGLRIIAGYAYTDARITKADDAIAGLEGSRSLNVPEHSGSLWTVYEIQGGDLKGLGFGAGVVIVGGGRQGNIPGDVEVDYTLPGYTLTNALLYYRRDNWKVQLNIDNLFNESYFKSSSYNSVYYGAPFTIRGQVSFTF